MAHLSLSLLGPFQVALAGQPVTSFKSVKVRALLAYLAVEADRPHPRELLAGLLWPEWPDRDALSNLRYALSDLRRAIGDRAPPSERARSVDRARSADRDADPPFLLVSRDTLQFNTASDHSLDVAAFTSQVDSHDLSVVETATHLYRGSFLEGFSVSDSAPFEEWALLTRERLARQMASALHHLAAAYEQLGEYQRVQSFAHWLLELEPWDEAAHQRLMRALALGGQRSAALAQYQACSRLLDQELGVDPAAETTQLYEQIRDGELAPAMPFPSHPPAPAAELPPFLRGEEPAEAERPLFVARQPELARLDRFLDLALSRQGRVAFVTGEAGAGKTAILQEFAHRAQVAHPDLIIAAGHCNAHTGVGDPYLPFRGILRQITGDVEAPWAAGAMTTEQARRLWSALPVALQALAESGPDLISTFILPIPLLRRAQAVASGGEGWLGQLTQRVDLQPIAGPAIAGPEQADLFEQYTRVLQSLAQRSPILLLLDDLQWADLGSINLLFHLARQLTGSPIMILGAYRPEEVALGRVEPWTGSAERQRHPLEPVVHELQRDLGDITVNLGQAEGRGFVEALLDSEPNQLADSFREALYKHTQGHPLFTIELLRGLQERGDLVRDDKGRWVEGTALDWETLPARVEAVVAERIGRLSPPLRDLLRLASVEGETFTAEVLARTGTADDRDVVQWLSKTLDRRHRLVRAQGVVRVGSRRLSMYRFRHILYQKYLYGTLDPVERAHLHDRIGTTLEELHGPQGTAAIAIQLARHFEVAGITEKAVHYLHEAGARSVRLSAYPEGLAHLRHALDLLMTLPPSCKRDRQELRLQLALGRAWQGTAGTQAPGVKDAYSRALALCQQLGESKQLYHVLGELATCHLVRAEHNTARAFAEQALNTAQGTGDTLLEALSRWYLGVVVFHLGEYAATEAYLESLIDSYVPGEHHRRFVRFRGSDAGVSAMAYSACCMWCLGFPEQALERSQQALSLARELNHPFTLVDVLCFGGCILDAMRRDIQSLNEHAKELTRLSDEKVPGWSGTGESFRGGAMAFLGEAQRGLALLREADAVLKAKDSLTERSIYLGLMAEAQALAGHPKDGIATLTEALAFVEQTSERYYEAELYRLRGKLLLAQGQDGDAQSNFLDAIEVARSQSARSWELRATTSLARLWQRQGKIDQARQALAQIYGWFTEGFDTRDLIEARALLGELAQEHSRG